MSNLPQTLLGHYQYTALDELSACTRGAQPSSRRFYLGKRLSTEIQGDVEHSIMQHEDQLLAQQQRQAGTLHTHLLATDQQRSVLALLDASRPKHLAYSPYGHRAPENGLLSLLGFNGERPDPVTGCYLLGNGYRAFNPVLMRFNSPDSWSPFGRGGLNAYGYCVGDPVNRMDRTGHFNLKLFAQTTNFALSKLPNTHHPTGKLSKTTVRSMKKTLKEIGGEASVQRQADAAKIEPNKYFLDRLADAQQPTPVPPNTSVDINFLDTRRNELINKEIVMTDLRATAMYFGNDRLVNDFDAIINSLQAVIEKNRNAAANLQLGLPLYKDVINSQTSGLPSYSHVIRTNK